MKDTDGRESMDVKVIVAAHKPYEMPEDPMYLPVQVGAAGKKSIGFQRDDENEQISDRNPRYCELTGLYWAWKNLSSDALGLAHYRRHFKGMHGKDGMESVLTKEEAERLLQDVNCLVPRKQHYVIETVYSHYEHTHFEEDLQTVRDVLSESHPDYLPAFDECMQHRSAHMFNMFIMKRELSDAYCTFLFDVLGQAEKRIHFEGRDPFQARVMGRLGELLLDVWLTKNRIRYKEIPVVYMEKIDWTRKVTHFLKAKFLHKKYDSSF